MMWDTSVSFSIELHSGVKLQQTDCTVTGLEHTSPSGVFI